MKPLALLVAFSKAYKNSPSGLTHKQSAEYVAREFLFAGARYEARTRDIQLGKLTLYQLS